MRCDAAFAVSQRRGVWRTHMAETKRDFYEVLGLQKGASDADIKKAFRQMAKNTIPI